ncbi:MAG: NAD-dependent epimerase/dehydratase family protein [Nanoarchaeota archaeon]
MDEFFDSNLIPIIETNRGCPYTCTYCAWGNSVQRKLAKFPLERVKKEIEYISKKIKNTSLLLIADANFGIFERDIEIAEFIKKINKKTSYPRYVGLAFAKNVPDRVIKIAELMGDMASVTASFQSLNPKVLENIKRPNMSTEHFREIQQYFNSKHIPSHSELILGLPGETKKSHADAIKSLIDFNTSGIVSYNLRMLNGAEINTPSQKEKYGIKTKFRLIDNGFGKYGDIISIEGEEMVLGTTTMTPEDILFFRPIHWLVQFMWNYKYYVELLHFLKNQGVNPLDYIIQILKLAESPPMSVKNIIDEFYRDSSSEWFDSKEELDKHYLKAENLKNILSGGFGKLNYRYTYKVLIECKEDFDTYLHSVALSMLRKRDRATEENTLILLDIFNFLKYSYVDFKKGLDSIKDRYLEVNFDILNWKKDAYSKPLKGYKKSKTIKYKFQLPDEQLKELKKIYKQFEQEDLNLTLRKMVEHMNIRDLFYHISYATGSISANQKKKDIDNILVNSENSIKQAMRVIDRGAIKMAIVVDDTKKLKGVITDGDIRRALLNGISIDDNLSGVMNNNPIYAKENDSEDQILNLINDPKIMAIPLVNKETIVKDLALLSKTGSLLYFKKHELKKRNIEKILVIGGGGYIGSVLVRKLLSKGYKVNILDKFIYGKESVKEIESNSSVKIIEGDTRHIEDITSSIENVDAVVHLAELVGDPACALKPSATQEINYLATRTVAAICKHFQINRLVYASSCSVYGASKEDKLLSESSPINPVSLYANMKIASEKALLEMKDDNFRPTILRLGTVFGYSYRPRFDLVVNLLTAKAVRENKITVFGGNQWRPHVHVADVADTIIKVLETNIETVGSQIFNVGMEENNLKIDDLGRLIKQIIPQAELIIEEKEDDRNYKIDFTKLRNTLNIKLKMRVIDGIHEVKKALEENKDLDYKSKEYSNIKCLEDSKNNEG